MSKRSVPDKTQASSKQPKVARPWADEFMLNAVGLQTFDVAQGQHPVKWLLETLSFGEGILEALWTWIDEMIPGAIGNPVELNSQAAVSDQKPIGLQTLSLTSIWYNAPSDGIPLYLSWKGVAMDLYTMGYESFREPLEVRVRASSSRHGQALCVKGLGRMSVIYFGCLWSFLNKDKMSDEVKADFCRWVKTVVNLPCNVVHESDDSHYEWKRIQTSEQQAQRERKNIMQKALVFARRAKEIVTQEPSKYVGKDGFRDAFLRSVGEYNNFGVAASNPKYQVPSETALELYGFKVGVADSVWDRIERHLHQFRWEQSAFSRELLLDHRWLLEGTSRVSSTMWHSILKVTCAKQELFLDRILLLHGISARRAGSRTVVRLTLPEFQSEVEVCCALGWLIDEMSNAVFDDGTKMFEQAVLDSVRKRAIEGDFHAEIKEVLAVKDPTYKASFAACWQDNVKEVGPGEDRFSKADEALELLSKDARKVAFERDCLQFARDVATVGQLFEADQKSEKSKRTSRILHLKNQNVIGASVVKNFMETNVGFKQGFPWDDADVTLALEKFTNEIGRNAGGVIIWCDFSKLGKVSGKELNAFADVIASTLRLKPASMCAFAAAPILISEKVSSHWRDELRRFEDKFDAKQVRNTLISVRMELPPSSKRVPIVYHAWMLMDEATLEHNIFTQSQLWLDRAPRKLIPFQPETSYIVPCAQRVALPHASEGMRSFSEYQETAQYLSGISFPEAILSALTSKVPLPSKTLGVINCTPYDCWLERACIQQKDTLPGFKVKSLSFSKLSDVVDYCEKTLSMELMQGWKAGQHAMGNNVRPYDPNPVEPPEQVNLTDFSFKMIQVELVDTNKKTFSEKYKVKVPPNVRGRYSDDVVFGSEWRELLADFDKKFDTKYSGPSTPAPSPVRVVEPELPPWVNEPATIQTLLDRYNVEAKVTGRLAGTTLFLVASRDRFGKCEEVEDRQDWKLFLAAHVPAEIDDQEYLIAHGASRFLKAEKVQDMKRKGKSGDLDRVMVCQWSHDEEDVVLEVQESKSLVDTEKSSWQKLLAEFEEEGYADLSINGHELAKHGGVEGEESWEISPKAAQVYYTWTTPTSMNGVKYSSLASAFCVAGLEKSRLLSRVWRVAYVKEAKEFTPRKPLYFPKKKLTLAENQVIRVI